MDHLEVALEEEDCQSVRLHGEDILSRLKHSLKEYPQQFKKLSM